MFTQALRAALAASAALALVATSALNAQAHMMPVGHGTINVIEAKAYIVVSLPVRVFEDVSAVTTLADGVMTNAELDLNREQLRAAIRDRLKLDVGDQPATFHTILLNLVTGYDHPDDRGGELTMMIVAHLPNTVGLLSLHSGLWLGQDEPLKIRASIAGDGGKKRFDVGELTPESPAHTFFATPGSVSRSVDEAGVALKTASPTIDSDTLQLVETLARYPAGCFGALPRLLLSSLRHGASIQEARVVKPTRAQ